jgi:hypothetical protein
MPDDDTSQAKTAEAQPDPEPTSERQHQFRNDCAYQIPEA